MRFRRPNEAKREPFSNFFTLGPGFKKVRFQAEFIWTIGPNDAKHVRLHQKAATMERSRDYLEKSASKVGQINQHVRNSYDANFKLMVVNEAESSNNCKAAKKFGVTECNVQRWRAQKERLKNTNSQRKAFRGPQSGKFAELDDRIYEYVIEKRRDAMPITREIIQLRALELAKDTGWCTCKGLTLRRRTSLAQRLPSDFEEKLLSFQRYVLKLRKTHSYPLDQIGNADQTPVFFDMPTSVNVAKKGDKSVIVRSTGNEKNRITVMLACLADGTKLPPYVILKRKTMPKETMPAGIIVRAQEKGWMDTDLVVDWLKVVWGRRCGALHKKRNMLVLDAFRGHLMEPVKTQLRKMNGDLVIIPGGMTSQLQVLDVVVNKSFKDNLCKRYTEWLLSGDHSLTPTGKLQKPADAISQESIIHGFKKCCISNALDGSEDDILWEGLVEHHDSDDSESLA
uniref:HTH CENPB-type domain-containing protein n=1 Tax=Sander lucioperca TaxID=283035 RepID=A0A8D0DA03_SANLU